MSFLNKLADFTNSLFESETSKTTHFSYEVVKFVFIFYLFVMVCWNLDSLRTINDNVDEKSAANPTIKSAKNRAGILVFIMSVIIILAIIHIALTHFHADSHIANYRSKSLGSSSSSSSL